MDENNRSAEDSEKRTSELDDVEHREELRRRYDMLLQELRVALPGVQILLAFLLTTPFSQRFAELDVWGRRAYAVALCTAMLSVISLLAPTILHRLGDRRARAARLLWGTRLIVVGLALLAVALMASMWGIARFVFATGTVWWLVTPVVVALVTLWLILPLTLHRHRDTSH